MDPDFASRKKVLRQEIRSHLKPFFEDWRRRASSELTGIIRSQSAWKNSKSILLYAPLQDELDVGALMQIAQDEGKEVALPRYRPETGGYGACVVKSPLVPGHLGILEPPAEAPIFPLNRLDFILVPGVAFDLTGHRLGRGKGFYDRLLAEVGGLKCGVCLEEQIVAEVPAETHDQRVNCLATPVRWISFP